MKKVLLASCAVLFAAVAFSQENRFSVGLELGIPTGDFGEVAGFGVGGSLGYEIPVGDKLGVIAQAGYVSFAGKEYDLGFFGTVKGPSWGMIPVQAGAKFYFTDNQEGAYLFGMVGIHSMSAGGASNTELSFAPGLGYIVGENIDLGLRYQIISGDGSSLSYLGLRAAYLLGSR